MRQKSSPRQLFRELYNHYGPQNWWPAETPFEVMVGAILTQNTAWERVETAIDNLRTNNLLSAEAILSTAQPKLAELIRPSGYFNQKAKRLHGYCAWYIENEKYLWEMDSEQLREELLQINGVGPETADDILLYAFERPVFVVDAYTRRIFQRTGSISGDEPYEMIRHLVERDFRTEGGGGLVKQLNEFHALIVEHAKQHCKKRPSCKNCPISCDFQYLIQG